jgi:hypothetical protein
VNFCMRTWDSAEMEKARLLTAARLRSSRILLMSSFSASASSTGTTGLGSSFLSWGLISCDFSIEAGGVGTNLPGECPLQERQSIPLLRFLFFALLVLSALPFVLMFVLRLCVYPPIVEGHLALVPRRIPSFCS